MTAILENKAARENYGKLLKKELPHVIRTEEENEHWLAVLEALDEKESLTPAEKEFSDLLTVLIEDFEAQHYPLRAANPTDVLRELMDVNSLRQRDLIDIFRSESIVSEVLSGKRALTTGHIRKLVQRFHVPADLFFPRAA